jgi:hypothetical protein
MTRRAAEILEILAERRTVEPRVMIVVAHPDDETIGMGAQLCGFHDALLLQVTDGAPRDGRDAAAHGFANIAEWLLSWWGRFGNGAPVVLTARNDGQLIAVLPLYEVDEAGWRKLLPIGISLSDYLDALVDSDHSGAAGALLASLIDLPGWKECCIPDLPPRAALLAGQRPAQLTEHRSAGETCPVLALPDTVAELCVVVPRKTLRAMCGKRAAAPLLPVRSR